MDSPLSCQATPATPRDGVSVVDIVEMTKKLKFVDTPKSTNTSRQRIRTKARRSLFGEEPSLSPPSQPAPTPWSDRENIALVSFLMLFTDGKSWPVHKHQRFWGNAAVFIQKTTFTAHCRSWNACRSRVMSNLKKKFSCPFEAERHYNLQQSSSNQPCYLPQATMLAPIQPVRMSSDPFDTCKNLISPLNREQKLALISKLLPLCVPKSSDSHCLPPDFLELTLKGLKHLHQNGRSNVIYSLVQGLGTLRGDGSDTLIPLKRMPMGLIEYVLNFFTSSSVQKVKCPSDYRLWLQTMYILFGTKWSNIFNGPSWSKAEIMQAVEGSEEESDVVGKRNPIKAMVNVPALSAKTLRKDIAASGFSTGSEIQVKILEEAAARDPNTGWWIKADGCDVVKGLFESVRGVWSGDVDLNDGALQHLREEVDTRISFIESVGLAERSDRTCIGEDLHLLQLKFTEDARICQTKLKKANDEYQEKLQAKSNEQTLFALSRDVESLVRLGEDRRSLSVEIGVLQDSVSNEDVDLRMFNLARRLSDIKPKLKHFVERLFHFKRTPATHIFVLMISSDLRSQKPYAISVQCLPYAGMKEADIRRLINNLIDKMVTLGMKVNGFVSNGEFNYLRTKGFSRPLSVIQIRANTRKKHSHLGERTLRAMLTPFVNSDGNLVAERPSPSVDSATLCEIHTWLSAGTSFTDVVDRLRPRTVPPGYTYHNWKQGEDEDLCAKMKSFLAQMDYRFQINYWVSKGVPFDVHLYVPEIHGHSGKYYYEHEDDAHILKRIANHTRNGGPDDLCLEYYAEALKDPSTKLTYPAFTGARKQSVIDAERLFSKELIDFMVERGHKYEATYIETIHNWRRACDERGLTSLQRSKYNYCFLNLMLDELMPWHTSCYDFTSLEVNRSVKGILGFSKETLAGLLTNIEGTEFRRCQRLPGLPPENPRSHSTDDVECFFSVMRDTIGRNFTVKQVGFGFRKVCIEFNKRLNPDLPYYYHTSAHTRFLEGLQPSFNEPSMKPKRKHSRVPTREQPGAFITRRATMPVHGSLSIRSQFHNKPVDMLPLPDSKVHVVEHSYSTQ